MLGRVYEEAADAIASKELAKSAQKGRFLAQKPLFLAKMRQNLAFIFTDK
jgi:hypothetical protein